MTLQNSIPPNLQIVPLPAFSDNYIWLIHNACHAIVVDPGDAAVVEQAITRLKLKLEAILITHHHLDHTGGVELLKNHHCCRVFGPSSNRNPGITDPVSEGSSIELTALQLQLSVLEVPGHTEEHIAYLGQGALFVGDTLFSAGCGRLLGGRAEQLHASLQRIATLPGNTRVYCAHEYTLSNLRFSHAVEPINPERDAWEQTCLQNRRVHQPTLPSSIALECAVNPFLRTRQDAIRHSLATQRGITVNDDLSCFTALRAWKDVF